MGLANLFGVELWERFSYYGMAAILTYYLYYSIANGGLGIPQSTALGIAGAYDGLLSISIALGAWLADRVVGMERMVLYGGFIVLAGHLALALLPGLAGMGVGVILVALGGGAVKANASTLLGTLYSRQDPRRDAGFSLFYFGITLGSFLGPLITGAMQQDFGFHIGFGIAAIGMALGLIQYVAFRRNLGDAGKSPSNPLSRDGRIKVAAIAAGILGVIVVAIVTGMVRLDNVSQVATMVLIVGLVGYFAVMLKSPKVDAVERNRIRSFIPICIAVVVFWALSAQMFTALAVYSDERINWDVFGWDMPPSYFFLLETIWVLPLLLMASAVWTRLGDRAPSSPVKLGIGVILVGISFLLFLTMSGGTGKSSPLLAVFFILFFFALGEMLVAPVGLSVTTKLAPNAFRAQMMAFYYFAVGLGSTITGTVSGLYSRNTEVQYFACAGAIPIVVGLGLLLGRRWIGRMMEGVR